jgi:hypothetical protein
MRHAHFATACLAIAVTAAGLGHAAAQDTVTILA